LLNQLVFENLRHRPVRTLLSVFAVASGVTMILTLVGVSEGMLNEYQRRQRGLGADIMFRPPASSVVGMTQMVIPDKLVRYFEQQPYVDVATGVGSIGTGALFESVSGIEVEKFNRMAGGLKFISGTLFEKEGDIVVDQLYADTRKLKVGSTLKLFNRDWRVSGIVETGKLARLFLPIAVVQDLAGASGKYSQIMIKLKNPADTDRIVAELKANPELANYIILSMKEMLSLISIDNAPGLKPFIYVVVAVGVLFGFLGVFMSMYTAVLERTREIGILKSLGAAPQFILSILMREAFYLALIGSALGIVMSYLTQWAINTYASPSLQQQTVPGWWPRTTAIAVVGSLIGTFYPGWKAVRQDALEALSYD
jgi:putative ABC transport system permease protein